MRTILSILLSLLIFSCNKEENVEYDFSISVEGNGSYHYSMSKESGGGIVSTKTTFYGVALPGDLIEIKAEADSAKIVTVYLDCNKTGTHYKEVGSKVRLFKQF